MEDLFSWNFLTKFKVHRLCESNIYMTQNGVASSQSFIIENSSLFDVKLSAEKSRVQTPWIKIKRMEVYRYGRKWDENGALARTINHVRYKIYGGNIITLPSQIIVDVKWIW